MISFKTNHHNTCILALDSVLSKQNSKLSKIYTAIALCWLGVRKEWQKPVIPLCAKLFRGIVKLCLVWQKDGSKKGKGRKEGKRHLSFVLQERWEYVLEGIGGAKKSPCTQKNQSAQFFFVRGDGKLRSTDTSKVCPCPTRSDTDTHQTLHGMCQNTTPEVSYYF